MVEENAVVTSPRQGYSRLLKSGILFSTLGIVILIAAFSYGHYRLAQVTITLANMVGQLEINSVKQEHAIRQLTKVAATLKENNTQIVDKLQTQEKLLTEIDATKKGDFNQWHVAVAEYLVKLSSERITYTKNPQSALPLLERALQILSKIEDNNINNLRTALAKDIKDLQVQPAVDVSDLYKQILELDKQIDTLTLAFAPLTANKNNQSSTIDDTLPWWKKGLYHSANLLKQVIIIKRNENGTLPVVMPDEKVFLYQNLHAQMENIIWGLLHRNQEVYQSSILRSQKWVEAYFVQDNVATQTMLAEFKKLQAIDLTPVVVDLAPTILLFDQYLSANSTATVAQ